jgi:hypothetical protein
MKKFSKKSVLLFMAAMAVCAFAMPSMASAASWGPINSEHTLTSTNIGFTTSAITSACADSSFTADVNNIGSVLTVTSANFRRCTSTGPAIGSCTTTSNGTGFPWRATVPSTTNVQIHNVDIDILFENHPGSTACNIVGVKATLEGTLTNGHWTGNTTRTVVLNSSPGLTSTSALGTQEVFTQGTISGLASGLIVTG